jgi:nucleotide-binding universal stress UspA family protein
MEGMGWAHVDEGRNAAPSMAERDNRRTDMLQNELAGYGIERMLTMIIIVGFDGSNVAGEAVNLAIQHAKAFGARVELVWTLVKGTENEQQDIAVAEKALAYRQSMVQEAGVECGVHLLIRGRESGEDLVEFAAENQAAEIIIGIRRRSKVGKLLFGSTAQFVILNAPCPVVTVK